MSVTCAAFEAAADDLALGFTPSPERDDLVAHAATCAGCGALLRELTTVVDTLLELAPEAEPPVGFEASAVAAMRTPHAPASRADRRRLVAAVAVAALALVVSAIVMTGTDEPSAEVATVHHRDGRELGRVELVAAPAPKVVVVLEDDDWPGTWICQLEDDDGTWVEVGRWTADDAAGGAWATAIDHDLLDATRMRITSPSGAVIATSTGLA